MIRSEGSPGSRLKASDDSFGKKLLDWKVCGF